MISHERRKRASAEFANLRSTAFNFVGSGSGNELQLARKRSWTSKDNVAGNGDLLWSRDRQVSYSLGSGDHPKIHGPGRLSNSCCFSSIRVARHLDFKPKRVLSLKAVEGNRCLGAVRLQQLGANVCTDDAGFGQRRLWTTQTLQILDNANSWTTQSSMWFNCRYVPT